MTQPQPAAVACRCGHSYADHDGELAPQCHASGCQCIRYRPEPSAAPPAALPLAAVGPARPVPAPTLGDLLAAAERSSLKRTRSLAARVQLLVNDLRARLDEERIAAEAKRRADEERKRLADEVAVLEAELKAARAKLTGKTTTSRKAAAATSTEPKAKSPCPDCGHEFVAVGAHRAKAHGYRAS